MNPPQLVFALLEIHFAGEHSFESYRSWSPLTEEGYAEKLRLLREAASVPMERWRAPTVLAWLEVALGMPQYGSRCAENIKSGKASFRLSNLPKIFQLAWGTCLGKNGDCIYKSYRLVLCMVRCS